MSLAPNTKKTPVAIRIAVVLGGLILLAAAGYFLLIAPKKKEAKSLSQDIVLLDQQISEQNAQATQAAGLSRILVADYNKLQTAMPNQPKMDEVLLQLNSVAEATGVRFDNYQPGTAAATSAYQVLPVTVTFQGTFDELSDFLYRIQSLVLVDNHELSARGRLFNVNQVSFAQGEKNFPQLAATIQIDAYAFGPPVGSAASATPSTTSTTTTSTTSTTDTTTSSSSETTTSAMGGGGS